MTPITIRDKTYPSVKAAAEALGVSTDAIRKARAKDKLDTVGLNPRGRHHGLPVQLGKDVYASIPDAVEATGYSYWSLRELALEQHRQSKQVAE